MNKKIYIAGCGGMLGRAFYDTFKDEYDLKCTDKDANDYWLSFLDFRFFDAYRKDVIDFNPDYLFHLGAYTDLEYCENNPDDTYMNNTQSVENAVYIANQLDIPLLYISTAGIFDGQKVRYDDWDIPNPLGVYARSKYMGERYVVEHAKRYLVCRAGWMMGSGAKDKKFIGKILEQLKQGNKNLYVVDDKFGSPTYTYDFAYNVKMLLKTEFWGLYNMACSGETSRLEITKELVDILGLKDVTVNPVPSKHFSEDYYAPRPQCEQLTNLKLENRGLNLMRHWKVALKEYLETYKDYL